MEAAGAALPELKELAAGYRDCDKIMTLYADLCAERGEPSFAVAELERAVSDASLNEITARVLRLRLLKLYEACRMQDKALATTRALLKGKPTSLRDMEVPTKELLQKYKGFFAPEQWETERDKLLEGMQSERALCDCLVEEGLYERLYEHAVGAEKFEVPPYESELMQVDPELVFSWYEKRILEEFEYAHDRKAYRSGVKSVVHVAQLPDGEKRAAKIAEALRKEYPRKPALLQELGKAGF